MSEPDEPESRRSIARRAQREAGEESAALARTLLSLSDSVISKLELDDRLASALTRARKTKSMVARRREERALAGELRGTDLPGLSAQIAAIRSTGVVDPELHHAAERWRDRLLSDDAAAAAFIAKHPDARGVPLGQLIAAARRERDSGRPPGSGRALFRQLLSVIRAHAAAEAEASADADAEANVAADTDTDTDTDPDEDSV
jgi:ribosome-associated protein